MTLQPNLKHVKKKRRHLTIRGFFYEKLENISLIRLLSQYISKLYYLLGIIQASYK